MARTYRLGRREDAVSRTRAAILSAARELLVSGKPEVSAGAVAARAGVSRITVYNQFGSKAGLLRELSAGARQGVPPLPAVLDDPREELRQRILESCSMWSSDPALFRRLPALDLEMESPNEDRALADRLAASDQLRPGCSLKEAQDVIGALTSFPVFDRLYKDGRRSTGVVGEVLIRLAAAILR